MISKVLLQAWAVSAYRYAATPPPITADQVISDDFGGAFCGDQDGSGCTVRAPGAKTARDPGTPKCERRRSLRRAAEA